MAVTPAEPEAYARALKALLPPSAHWNLDTDSTISKLFLGVGDELSRVDQRGADLIAEADPSQADELLPEWERLLGITASGTEAERRTRILALVVRRPRYRPIDFQRVLAPVLGLAAGDVVIEEQSRAYAISVGDDREIYRFFVYRNPALGGTYDLAAAQAIVDAMKPSHTVGHVYDGTALLCDDPGSLCDADILGV